jgi:hypothetical protein
MITSLPAFSIAWTREQLDAAQAAAWATWISYGANVRRLSTAAWFEMQATSLAPVPKAEAVTPDEIIPPGGRTGFSNPTYNNDPRTGFSYSEYHGFVYRIPHRWYWGNI